MTLSDLLPSEKFIEAATPLLIFMGVILIIALPTLMGWAKPPSNKKTKT